VVQNLSSLRVSKISTLKKVSRTSPRDASLAATPVKTADQPPEKCTLQFAHHVAVKLRFPFSRKQIVLFTAAIVFLSRDNFCLNKGKIKHTLIGVFLFFIIYFPHFFLNKMEITHKLLIQRNKQKK
jgi:hypothetical protein